MEEIFIMQVSTRGGILLATLITSAPYLGSLFLHIYTKFTAFFPNKRPDPPQKFHEFNQ